MVLKYTTNLIIPFSWPEFSDLVIFCNVVTPFGEFGLALLIVFSLILSQQGVPFSLESFCFSKLKGNNLVRISREAFPAGINIILGNLPQQ